LMSKVVIKTNILILILTTAKKHTQHQCCGSGIRCLFDPWIRSKILTSGVYCN
jgi:hypothetical protein